MKWVKGLFLIYFCLSFFNKVQAEFIPSPSAKLQKINWSTTHTFQSRFNSYFDDLVDKPWDALSFKIKTDQIAKELFTNGYFGSEVKSELSGSDSLVFAKINIETKGRTNFHFSGNTLFSYQELHLKILDKIKNEFNKTDRVALENFIIEVYEAAGFYNTTVKSYQNESKDLDGLPIKTFFFAIDEGEKLKVSDVLYRGNMIFSGHDLNSLFQKNASSLAAAGFYDKAFFEGFSDVIKKEYLSKGFVFAEISKPRVISSDDDEILSVEYGISEKQQVILKSISLGNTDKKLIESVKKILTNKEGEPVNIVELESDLKKIVNYFQNQGFYFANISNLNSDNLIIYDKSLQNVDLHVDIKLDRRVCFNEVLVKGTIKTQPEVILREIDLHPGDMITPDKLEAIRIKLSGLGLFSNLRLSPYMTSLNDDTGCTKTNLQVQVKEKDFGLGEIAPGYRTDLGAKLSTGIIYNNLMGMNRSVSVKAQMNQRFNLDGFDERRRTENKSRMEYLGKVSFVEPYLFNDILKSQYEFELSSSFQRKRFSAFDADIFSVSPQLSKSFGKYFSTSVRYQFERINQFDATQAIDNDNFSIGGITPSVTVDLRDNPINPRKGSFFSLSSEWANHYFGSMKNSDLEVNYMKVINRNKFYYPLGDFTLAFSLALGYEKNFAQDLMRDASGNVLLNSNGVPRTHGYIPNIKVFRLDGFDEVRGYGDDEINRLKNGQKINGVVVQNEAYFTAFKFEPRYNITDSILIGVFYDAGRVSVDSFHPFDLRSSVGSGLKFLTPVGSLDFDYGVKLQRKTYPDSIRDSVSRFHLSIGFF